MVEPIAARIKKTLPPSFELDDLVSTGYLALIHVAQSYRPDLHNDTPFSAFAHHRIRGAILDSIRRRHYRDATHEEIPPDLQVPFRDPIEHEAIAAADELLTMEWGPYGKRRKRLAAAIGRLTTRERCVLGVYYAENQESVAKAGKFLGLSEQRVTLEHDAAITKLRLQLAA
jgi:RNA polymerase sigma factor for flagellar operon FliA